MPKIVWNAIVRNEAARIERCINSMLPWIAGAVVVDTGSTDGTPEIIRASFERAGKPCLIGHAPFENFEQARNAALNLARARGDWDWLLLVDADMELVVEDKTVFDRLKEVPSYDVLQRTGGVSYYNRRLLHRRATGSYIGVTHEYLDVPSIEPLVGLHFIDHADGANRPDKYERDIALLKKGIEEEPRAHVAARYWFYLAQSYRDAGMWELCRDAYKKAVEVCTWDEERFVSQMNYAEALGHLGDENAYVIETLKAYQMRPWRKESLYNLAKFFREKDGMQNVSLLFSEPGLEHKKPGDYLFVPDYPYDVGFREEFSICAFYDDKKRAKGAQVTNILSLDAGAPGHSRDLARLNTWWYLRPLKELIGDYQIVKVPFDPPEGWAPMNPSVVNHKNRTMLALRTVNYIIDDNGQYVIGGGQPYSEDNPIRTRTYLIELDPKTFQFMWGREIYTNLPEPKYKMVRGLEDQRLFVCDNELYTVSCAREMNVEGWPEQVLSRLDGPRTRWFDVLPKEPRECQKNWMPWSNCGHELRFSYRLGQLIDIHGNMIANHKSQWDFGFLGGGSQVIPFSTPSRAWIKGLDPQHYLCVVHAAHNGPDGKRYYNHRFALLDVNGACVALSPPFCLHDRQIEYVMGLAWRPGKDELLMSYGVRDREAYIAILDPEKVWGMLKHA